jgi:hypothetical protein
MRIALAISATWVPSRPRPTTPSVQRPAADFLSERGLQWLTGFHSGVFETDLARQFEHQADRQRGGRIAEHAGAADQDAALLGSLDVEGGVMHRRRDEQLQLWQPLQRLATKQRAFPHRADDIEIGQRPDDIVGCAEVPIEYGHVHLAAQSRPVGHFESDVLVVVKNSATQCHVMASLRHAGACRQRIQAGHPISRTGAPAIQAVMSSTMSP